MKNTPRRSSATRLLALGVASLGLVALPTSAFAGDAVVTPMVARGIDPLVSLNMASLVSSEIDFMGAYGNVDQLDAVPKTLNAACLNSASCLGGIAKEHGAQAVITGALAQVGNKFDFFLVLYDNGRIVRKKEFTLPNVPSIIADSMGGHVKELITGEKPIDQSQGAAAVVDAGAFDDFDDEDDAVVIATGNSRRIPTSSSGSRNTEMDDFDLEDDGEDDRRAREEEEEERKAAAAAARQREAERQQAEDERRAEEKRRAAAVARERELERQRAEDERRREDERRAAAAAAAAAADDDPDEEADEDDFDFSFGGGVTIDEGEEDDDDGRVAVAYVEDDPPARRSSTRDDDLDFSDPEPRRTAREDRYDLDDDGPSRPSREDRSRVRDDDSRARKDTGSSTADTKASIAVRGGYSRFQDLNFVTYGAEAAFMATPNLAIVAGAEAYSTRRVVPVDQLEEGQLAEQWNTILPLNAGLQYKFGTSNVRPYVGGGLQIIPGVVKDQGGVAIGLRARGGADFAVTDVFGFNVNIAAGMWSGQQFQEIQSGFGASALVPQFSAGTIFLF